MLARRGALSSVMSRSAVALVLACAAASACARGAAETPPPHRAFYFWRTTFAFGDAERRALRELGVDRIYLRVFDVGWNDAEQRATPLGPITAAQPPPAGIDIVPVVFVRDEVLRRAKVETVARDMWSEIERAAARVGFVPHEVQLDCDWTEHTKNAYFALVRELRAASHLPLSATIRLHQIKYRERTGVPPVDRGTLMFYNMGKFSADPDARSIFDASAAERYLARVGDYPLPLDVALPIWSWTVHVRDGMVVGLMQSTDPAELASIDFLARLDDGRYVATRTTFLHGELVRAGDLLKQEVTGPEETLAAATLVAPHLPPAARTVTLFDLSERNLARHDPASLDRVFRAVR